MVLKRPNSDPDFEMPEVNLMDSISPAQSGKS